LEEQVIYLTTSMIGANDAFQTAFSSQDGVFS
jgi:hypothetical protein